MNIFLVKCDEQDLGIDLLKENKIELRNVDKYMRNIVNELKLDGERNKNIILELQEELKENNEKIGKLNEKLQEMKSLFEIESKSIKLMIEKENDKMKLDGERNKKSIGALDKRYEQQNEQIQQFNNKYQQIENKFVNANQERENKEKDLIRNIDEMRKKQTEMRTMLNKIDQTMKNVENKLLKIEINQNKMKNGEFVWKINKINDKMEDAKNGINTYIFSDSFYTHKHGYKMRLSMDPDGNSIGKGTHLSVFFYLMKGEFDDILQWPFKYDVTISLINQQTTLDHVSETTKYDDFPNNENWNKPIYGKYDGQFGYSKFIELKELSTNANLTHNNQIFIKCSVNISS